MEPLSPPQSTRRWWWWSAGGVLGLLTSFAGPSATGCVYPDTCIRVTSPGHDWCRNLANAVQWPAEGSIEDSQPVLTPDGFAPQGCRCFNDAEHQILDDLVPECHLEPLLDEIELAARQRCQALVQPGNDHNCWTAEGPEASTIELQFPNGPGSCIGDCEYGGPPAGGSCPDPDPYECGTGDGASDCALEDDATDDGALSTAAEGTIDHRAVIDCAHNRCEIDEAFAHRLLDDPSSIAADGLQLVFDPSRQRHTFWGIEPGSLAHALRFRNGDRLERVGGTVIDGLDAALEAFVRYRHTRAIKVRVQRGSRWVDLVYTLVP